MSGALINLVRLNKLEETTEHDYTSGELFERQEEIKLEDPNGCPCAIPMPSSFQNIDQRYNFITGNIGSQTKLIRRNLTINIDYIDNSVARRLEHWMHQRAYVLVAPNYGRNTEFSFRPVRMAGTSYLDGGTAYDLTGNYAIEHNQSTSTLLLWDEDKRQFVKKNATDISQHFQTPGGAAYAAPRSVRNLMKPAYPEGATSGTGTGKSGWVKGGTDSGQITFSHNSGGFGHPDCPDSLTVDYTDDVTGSRLIEVRGLFDPSSGDYGGYTPTGSGDMVVCIWVRGQMPEGATALLIGGTGLTQLDLSGKRVDGWTPIIISRYEANWASIVPNFFISLASSSGAGGSFEIGPTMVQQSSGSPYNAGPYWVPDTTWAGTNLIDTVSNFSFPKQGTFVSSFFVPEYFGADYTSSFYCPLIGTGTVGLRVYISSGGNHYIVVRDTVNGGGSVALTSSTQLVPGKINTVAFVWNGDSQNVYTNGQLAGSLALSSTEANFGDSATPLKIGDDGYAVFPIKILTARIDEGAMTAEEVASLHFALTDPVALQFAMNQRGRIYQITAVPQTLRSSAGGSQVIGQVKLEQVDFQHWLADPLNVEEVVR